MARWLALALVVLVKDLEHFDILMTKPDSVVKETLGMVNVFVGTGCLKPILA